MSLRTTAAVPLETASSTEKGVPSARLGATRTRRPPRTSAAPCRSAPGPFSSSPSPSCVAQPTGRVAAPDGTPTARRRVAQPAHPLHEQVAALAHQSQPKCTSSGRRRAGRTRRARRCSSVSTGKRSTSTALWRNSSWARGAPRCVIGSTSSGPTHRIWSCGDRTPCTSSSCASPRRALLWGVWTCQMTLAGRLPRRPPSRPRCRSREVRVQHRRAVVLGSARRSPGSRSRARPPARSGRDPVFASPPSHRAPRDRREHRLGLSSRAPRRRA